MGPKMQGLNILPRTLKVKILRTMCAVANREELQTRAGFALVRLVNMAYLWCSVFSRVALLNPRYVVNLHLSYSPH